MPPPPPLVEERSEEKATPASAPPLPAGRRFSIPFPPRPESDYVEEDYDGSEGDVSFEPPPSQDPRLSSEPESEIIDDETAGEFPLPLDVKGNQLLRVC